MTRRSEFFKEQRNQSTTFDRVIEKTRCVTKIDLARYYATIAPFILAHLKRWAWHS